MTLYKDLGDKPPCSHCGKPTEALYPACETAVQLWRIIDLHDREHWSGDGMPLPLKTEPIRSIVRDYNLSLEMQELIIALEQTVLPMRQQHHQESKKTNAA